MSTTYYVNLEGTGTGHAGTSSDPYSFADWQTRVALEVHDSIIFHMKGSYTTTNCVFYYGPYGYTDHYTAYYPWNPSVNGPWRLHLTAATTGDPDWYLTEKVFFNGGILFVDTPSLNYGFSPRSGYHYNMYISTSQDYCPYSDVMKGCLINVGRDFQGYTKAFDSAFKIVGSVTAHVNTITNSAFTAVTGLDSGKLVNCQTDWSSPTMPAFSGNQAAFTDLYTDVDTPPQPGYGTINNYQGYSTDLWGRYRNGIGTGYMGGSVVYYNPDISFSGGTYYVNLSDNGSGHAGTESDPYSFEDWKDRVDTPVITESDIIFYMRGTRTTTNCNFYFTMNPDWYTCDHYTKYLPWGASVNGPWRLKLTNGDGPGDYVSTEKVNFKGGILFIDTPSATGFYPRDGQLYNMYVSTSGRLQPYGTDIKGSLLYSGDRYIALHNILQDSVLVASSAVASGSMSNCATNRPSSEWGLCYNSQFDWTSPVLPAFDASQSSFEMSSLYSTVTTPPKPGIGSPDYIDYEYDLWGNLREGIGTGYALVYPPVWITGYPKVGNRTTGHTIRFSVKTNKTGTAYLVIVPRNAPGPSSSRVMNGRDWYGEIVATGLKGSVSITADTEAYIDAYNLVPNTAYDAYLVAKSSSLQKAPVKISFTMPGNVLTKYVNLNASGTTGHYGTEADPFTVDDWQDWLTLNSSFVFYVKGTLTDNTETIKLSKRTETTLTYSYVAWNPIDNGPWRMKLSSIPSGSHPFIFLKGGILFAEKDGAPINFSMN